MISNGLFVKDITFCDVLFSKTGVFKLLKRTVSLQGFQMVTLPVTSN